MYITELELSPVSSLKIHRFYTVEPRLSEFLHYLNNYPFAKWFDAGKLWSLFNIKLNITHRYLKYSKLNSSLPQSAIYRRFNLRKHHLHLIIKYQVSPVKNFQTANSSALHSRIRTILIRTASYELLYLPNLASRRIFGARGHVTTLSGTCFATRVRRALFESVFVSARTDSLDEWHRDTEETSGNRRTLFGPSPWAGWFGIVNTIVMETAESTLRISNARVSFVKIPQ